MLVSILPTGVFAADAIENEVVDNTVSVATDDGVWEYSEISGGVSLTAYNGNAADVYVPSTVEIDGAKYAVLKLEDSIFENNDSLSSVTLGDGVLEIGARAFYDCDNLVCIVTNEQLTTIGDEAFSGCDVFNSIILYDTVTTIGTDAFADCPKLTIWCNENSAGYNYATENGIPYEILNPDAIPETYVVDGVTYYIMNGEAIAVDFDESKTEVTVPASVNGYPVTEFRQTFLGCTTLESVTLPEGIVAIGDGMFRGCTALTSVNIPKSVTTIGEYAFFGCKALQNITLPEGLKVISSCAFYQCVVLTDIIIPKTVTTIDDYAFANTEISEIIIPDTATDLGVRVFFNCDKLTDVKLPEGITKISANLFDYCLRLKNINFPDSIVSIESNAFSSCFALTGTLILPKNLQKIGTSAFSGCNNITEIVFPDTLTYISQSAFSSCSGLKSVTIPSSVTEISQRAFLYCRNLEEVILENGIKTLKYEVFNECDKLEKVIIPESVTSLSADTFPATTVLMVYEDSYSHDFAVQNNLLYYVYNGTNEPDFFTESGIKYYIQNGEAVAIGSDAKITEITIPSTVEGYPVTKLIETFIGNHNLKKVILSPGIKEIGSKTFHNCLYLNEITIPSSVETIGEWAFKSCDFTEVYLPDGLKTISSKAFYCCNDLVKINLPNSITSIGEDAFYSCENLTEISIPNNITTISKDAFQGCTSLSRVTIPEGVTRISTGAFSSTNLQKVIIPKSVTYLATDSFPTKTVLMVYEDSYAHNFAVENELVYFVYDGTNEPEIYTLDGVTYCIVNGEAIAVDFDESTTEVTVPSTVNGYPVTQLLRTFLGCRNITKVTLSEGLKCIDDRSFSLCSSLKEVNIPESVTAIEDYAFYNCYDLSGIEIPYGVTKIGESAFHDCTSLVEIYVPDSVTEIGATAFYDCRSLEKITLSKNITKISYYAFYNTKITDIIIPDGVTQIDTNAFVGCTSLKNVKLPDGLTKIGERTFNTCSSLRYLVLPESISSLYASTFTPSTILMVYENSYAHNFAKDNDFLYFVLHKTDNPEIAYGASVSGTATYTDGSVAAGAKVEILYNDGTVKETVATDDAGAYEFTYAEVGEYTIRVTDSDGNTAAEKIGVKRMNAFDVFLAGDTDLLLKKGYSVSGTVSQSPATVTLTDEDGNTLYTVNTEDGNFNFANVPNGTYIITAQTASGSVSQEVTVFNGEVSDIILEIASETATIWGYVEVEDREFIHHRRNWVQITVYNSDGIAVAQQKSDKDGKYNFANLPLDEYSVVAETSEMRPDKKHGYDRSHTLTGYAYIDASIAGTYQADTIVLREENDSLGTISGKVTANGEHQQCEVTLSNVFRHEVAHYTTGNNGKYKFLNVRDGLYFVSARTESDGFGFAVVVVLDGKVYGETDIRVNKKQEIKDREDRFKNDIPECHNREEAENYRHRIAEEKRYYDGLSKKEKNQLSKDYVERLNKYCEWIAYTEYTTDDGITVENGGLVVSGDELENEKTVEFTLTVEEREKWDVNTDGVKDDKDFIQHSIEDTAGDREIKKYYEISMFKTVNGQKHEIKSVQKNTDSCGSFRITMEIPEEYRGYKHYNFVHVHNGEVVTLVDLDNDPNTVTFEIDRFSTFALTATNEELSEVVADTTVIDRGCTLILEGVTKVKQYIAFQNLELSKDEIVANGGMLVWNELPTDATIGTEDFNSPLEYSGLFEGYEEFTAKTGGIVAKELGDKRYMRPYVVVDGEYIYGELKEYSAKDYATGRFQNSTNTKLKKTLAAMLNYGAAAQSYFEHGDRLMNSDLTDEQNTLVWNDDYITPVVEAEESMTKNFTATGTLKDNGKTLFLEGAVSVNYYFGLSSTLANNVASAKLYTWTAEEYEAIKASGEILSKENAGYTADAQLTYSSQYGYEYKSRSDSIAMKDLGDTLYAAICIIDKDGNQHTSGVLAYSPEQYAANMLKNGDTDKIDTLMKWMVYYGECANDYIG